MRARTCTCTGPAPRGRLLCACEVLTAFECLVISILRNKKIKQLVDLINNADVKSLEGGGVQSVAAVIVAGVNASAGTDG